MNRQLGSEWGGGTQWPSDNLQCKTVARHTPRKCVSSFPTTGGATTVKVRLFTNTHESPPLFPQFGHNTSRNSYLASSSWARQDRLGSAAQPASGRNSCEFAFESRAQSSAAMTSRKGRESGAPGRGGRLRQHMNDLISGRGLNSESGTGAATTLPVHAGAAN